MIREDMQGQKQLSQRSNFSGRLGFILAVAGSAVGLGNIWRFPYLAAQYGGGIFLLVYLVLVISFGFTIMTAEIALGRKTGLSAIGAFQKLNRKYAFIGIITAIIPVIILPYYSVIGGWITKYLLVYATGSGSAAAQDGFFSAFTQKGLEPVILLAVFLLFTFGVVLLGVKKGIEKFNKILMPALIILTVGIAIYSMCMPGAIEGVLYYVKPDFSKFSIHTVIAAMGQMFYSMSLAMGIMITYGSYVKKEENIEKSVGYIEIFDTGIAFLAGLMIVPAVFVFSGGDASRLNEGPGLMFVTLPKVFDSMPMGNVIGAVFFLLVLFAALTSSISLMETVVSIVQDKFHWGRVKSCLCVLLCSLALGIPSSLGFGALKHISIGGKGILDLFDFLSNSVLMPLAALLACLFIAYVVGIQTITDEVELSGKFKRKKMFCIMLKYIAPVFIIIILISSILNAFGIIKL